MIYMIYYDLCRDLDRHLSEVRRVLAQKRNPYSSSMGLQQPTPRTFPNVPAPMTSSIHVAGLTLSRIGLVPGTFCSPSVGG